jgi:2-methylaconitate cis-trans-isomerase PrpF
VRQLASMPHPSQNLRTCGQHDLLARTLSMGHLDHAIPATAAVTSIALCVAGNVLVLRKRTTAAAAQIKAR